MKLLENAGDDLVIQVGREDFSLLIECVAQLTLDLDEKRLLTYLGRSKSEIETKLVGPMIAILSSD
jgi:hypothetical protein